MSRTLARTGMAALLAAAPVASALAVPSAYVITVIPNLASSDPNSLSGLPQINRWGQVAGRSPEGHPVLFTPNHPNGTAGATRDLSLVPGFPATATGAATALNDLGEVTGQADVGQAAGGDANGVISWLYVPQQVNTALATRSGNAVGGVLRGAITAFAPVVYQGGSLAAYTTSINNVGQIFADSVDLLPALFTPTPGQNNPAVGAWQVLSDTYQDYGGQINDAGQIDMQSHQIGAGNFTLMLIAPGGAPDPAWNITPNPQIWDTTQSVSNIGMNQHGDLAIDAVPQTDNRNVHAFVWKAGQQPVDVSGAAALPGFAAAIDDAGTVLANLQLGGSGSFAAPAIALQGVAHNVYVQLPAPWRNQGQSYVFSGMAMNDAGQLLLRGPAGQVLLATPRALTPPAAAAACAAVPGQPNRLACSIANATPALLTGLSLAFDACPVAVQGSAATTLFAAPAGSPIFNMPAGADAVAAGQQTATVPVTFTGAVPAGQCTPRILHGTSPR